MTVSITKRFEKPISKKQFMCIKKQYPNKIVKISSDNRSIIICSHKLKPKTLFK